MKKGQKNKYSKPGFMPIKKQSGITSERELERNSKRIAKIMNNKLKKK